MLYRVALFALIARAAAQDCAGADAGTDACACYFIPCADVSSLGTAKTLTTSNGPVTGRLGTDSIERYFGVPIAANPTGNNRFKPPQASTWTTAVTAVTEKQCPQWGYPIGGTENCLTVDLMFPTGGSGLAVAYWVHGGGFTVENPYFVGLTHAPHQKYNFAELPNTGKVITVLSHYRLGALGWMAHPGFIDSSQTFLGGATTGAGNYGMMDTLNGLSWVQANAAAMGGDPTKVTVFGESAGGAHVTMLMASPLSQGLAATFIAQSPYISYGAATFSQSARMEMNTLFTHRAGCTSSIAVPATGSAAAFSEAACLRTASIVTLIVDTGFGGTAGGGLAASTTAVAAFTAAYSTLSSPGSTAFLYNSIHVWPVVDGYILDKAPLDSIASGNNAAATIVVGHNADEYSTFCYSPPFGPVALTAWACATAPDIWNQGWILGLYYLPLTASWTEISTAVIAAMAGAKVAQIKAGLYYSDFVDPIQTQSVQMGTDAWFATGNEQVIEAFLSQSTRTVGTVYHYVFAQDTDPQFPVMGACHGCELTYVLGFFTVQTTYLASQAPPSLSVNTVVPSGGSILVGTAMNKYWASLFYYATPNTVGSGLPQWVPMATQDKQTMTFQGYYTYGALMNPCVRWASCRTEPTKDWRSAKKHFWSSSPAATLIADPVCTGPVKGYTSHITGSEWGINCTFLPCCTYPTSYTEQHSYGRRSLLFGMPSAASTACDPVC